MTEQNTVAVQSRRGAVPADAAARIEEARVRNAVAAQIRGTQWGNGADDRTVKAVAMYCQQNGLDPVRHVEVLGGRLYLTATLYREKAAPWIRAGVFVVEEADFINADQRLDELAEVGDEWALEERTRRMRLRIKHAVPEAAVAAAVVRIHVPASGMTAIGVNWTGGGTHMKTRKDGGKYDDDPVGNNEPTKTAETRAERRAWVKLLEAVQLDTAMKAEFEVLKESRGELTAVLDRIERDKPLVAPMGRKALPVPGPTEYGGNANPGTSEVLAGVTVTNAEDVPKRTFPPAHTLGNPYPGDVPDLEPPAPPVASATTDDDEDEEPFQ